MSLQGLGDRKVHSLEALTGYRIVRGYLNNSANHHVWYFTTNDHRHGWYDKCTGEWAMVTNGSLCTSLCLDLFAEEGDE